MKEDKLCKSVSNQSNEKLLDKAILTEEDNKPTEFNLATSIQLVEDHVV